MGAGAGAGASSRVVVLEGAADLRRYSWGAFMSRPARLEIGGAATETVSRWQARLDRHALACGCSEGSLLVFLTLIALVVKAVTGLGPLPADGPLAWVAALFGAALVGKVLGLLWANLRLRVLAGAIAAWEGGAR